jgi:hypothetical protein
MQWRGAMISCRQVDFRSTSVENYGSEPQKASPLFAKGDSNPKIFFLRD